MAMNLVQHRGEPSVWDRRPSHHWDTERWVISAVAGAVLAAGFRRRDTAGLLLTMAGGALAWWACSAPEERQARMSRVKAALPRRRAAGDPVLEASEESFPASDAPAWSGNAGPATRAQ